MLNRLLNVISELNVMFGVPVVWSIGVIIIATLMSIFAGEIYRMDLKLGYGKVLGKLYEIIADMESLRE